jgi:hypothetical protein
LDTLADWLNFVVSTLQASPLCNNVRILETHPFSTQQFALKARASLRKGYVLQVHLYRNFAHTDYAYQLFQQDQPILRWDNKEHFPNLSTYPHHFHTPSGKVEESTLIGTPRNDLPAILAYVDRYLAEMKNE